MSFVVFGFDQFPSVLTCTNTQKKLEQRQPVLLIQQHNGQETSMEC